MSDTKWFPSYGYGTCSHMLHDGNPCGKQAIRVNLEGTVYLCAEHKEYTDPALQQAREDYLKELESHQ